MERRKNTIKHNWLLDVARHCIGKNKPVKTPCRRSEDLKLQARQIVKEVFDEECGGKT